MKSNARFFLTNSIGILYVPDATSVLCVRIAFPSICVSSVACLFPFYGVFLMNTKFLLLIQSKYFLFSSWPILLVPCK